MSFPISQYPAVGVLRIINELFFPDYILLY